MDKEGVIPTVLIIGIFILAALCGGIYNGTSIYKDCEHIGASRIGGVTIICHLKDSPQSPSQDR